MSEEHPSDVVLLAILSDDAADVSAVESHLDGCELCRKRVEQLAGLADFDQNFAPHQERPDLAAQAMLLPCAATDALGCLDRFEVLEWIATEGSAVVWRARDPITGEVVALKVLQPLLAAQREHRQRFLRESAAMMRIQHANVLPILDIIEGSEPPFFVMPFMHGGSLQMRIDSAQGRALPVGDIVQVGRELSGALDAAHNLGIIHRDIKPSNVLISNLDEGGIQFKLADFGLARAMDAQALLTRSGSFLGTPEFMSPEQAAGLKELDARSDLFSLGALLYAVATGKAPFCGDSFLQLSEQVREMAPVRCDELNPELPPWLANLIMRLLSKRPQDRPQSAAEVVKLIECSVDIGRAKTKNLIGKRARLFLHWQRAAWIFLSVCLTLGCVLLATETSGRTSYVNAIMGAKSGRYLYIVGKLGTYDSLSAVILAAMPGDIIEVRTNTPAAGSESLRIPPGKPLTLRAAKGFRPALYLPSQGWPAIGVVESPFTMEGFVISHTYKGLHSGRLLLAKGSPLKFVRCRFLRQPRPPEEMKTTGHALVALQDSPGIELIDCEFYAPGSPLIGVVATKPGIETTVQLQNSILWGTPVWCDDRPPDRLSIHVERCELVTNLTVQLKEAVPAERLFLRFHNNLIQSFGNVLQVPVSRAELQKIISWDSRGNLFFVQRNMALTQDGGFRTLNDLVTSQPQSVSDSGSSFTHRIATRFIPRVFAKVVEGGDPLRVEVPPGLFRDGETLPRVGPDKSGVGPFAD